MIASTHWPGGVLSARALRLACSSRTRGTLALTLNSSPTPLTWQWQSMKPGVMVAPAASICRVCALARLRMSAVDPTAMKRPFLIANASARGIAGSMVRTRALMTIASAAAPGPAPTEGWALASVSRPADAKPAAPVRAAPKPRNSLRESLVITAQLYVEGVRNVPAVAGAETHGGSNVTRLRAGARRRGLRWGKHRVARHHALAEC